MWRLCPTGKVEGFVPKVHEQGSLGVLTDGRRHHERDLVQLLTGAITAPVREIGAAGTAYIIVKSVRYYEYTSSVNTGGRTACTWSTAVASIGVVGESETLINISKNISVRRMYCCSTVEAEIK